jgi:hypothetical protein
MSAQATAAPADQEVEGRHDFDFLPGNWRIANRKLEDLLDKDSTWHEFESTLEAQEILGGLGFCEKYFASDFPGRGVYHGFGLRLFDPGAKVWRIWWASTYGEGQIDTPTMGRFSDGVGRFETDDVIGGRELKVRYDWTDITPSSARWEQSFSFDGGRTFEPNWIMVMTRVD